MSKTKDTNGDSKERLVLIDGHALLYRAFYAFPQSLTTRQGELVNAVYGFTRTLLSVIDELAPAFLVVSFDVGETFRHEEYPEYKAHREKMPEELKEQEPRVYELLEVFNVPVFTKDGYEADDVIGTVAWDAAERELESMIVTGDKDAFQLVKNEQVLVYVPGRGRKKTQVYDEELVYEEMGLWPTQVVDFKALAGDSSDNIPGVYGVGTKTATRLLQKYEDLDGVYAAVEAGGDDEIVKGAVMKRLQKDREKAYESQHLAQIVTDVPLEFEVEAALLCDYDKEEVLKLFDELSFMSLKDKLPNDEFEEAVQEALF